MKNTSVLFVLALLAACDDKSNPGPGPSNQQQSCLDASGACVPADGTVTTSMIADGAITAAKLSRDALPKLSHVVTVAQSGGDYTQINRAVDAITDASASNRYTVYVAPGIYGDTVNLKPGIDLVGASKHGTLISGDINCDVSATLAHVTVQSLSGACVAQDINIGGDSSLAAGSRIDGADVFGATVSVAGDGDILYFSRLNFHGGGLTVTAGALDVAQALGDATFQIANGSLILRHSATYGISNAISGSGGAVELYASDLRGSVNLGAFGKFRAYNSTISGSITAPSEKVCYNSMNPFTSKILDANCAPIN